MYNLDDERTVFTSQTNKHTAYIHIWARSNMRRTVGVSLLLSLSRFLRGRSTRVSRTYFQMASFGGNPISVSRNMPLHTRIPAGISVIVVLREKLRIRYITGPPQNCPSLQSMPLIAYRLSSLPAMVGSIVPSTTALTREPGPTFRILSHARWSRA
jgi:hypothetical protein